MQEIYLENLRKVLKNKNTLEKELEVKINNKGKNVFIDGDAEKEFIAIEILQAINLGFLIEKALLLKQEEIIFQTINIKEITKRHDLERVRARIIGTHGKTLQCLEGLSKCSLCLHYNQVGIIGNVEEIENAKQALRSLIQGSKQGNVYARLERLKKDKKKQTYLKNELKNKD